MTGALARTAEGITELLRDFFVAERIAAAEGFLQTRDPRVTVLALTGLVVATMLTRSPVVLGLFASIVVVLAVVSTVPLGRLAKRSAVVPLATALIVAPQLMLQPGPALVNVAGLTVTSTGVQYVLVFTFRVTVAVATLSLLVLTTPFSAVVAAARGLGVPIALVWVLSVTYRYLFLFFDELSRLLIARNSRTSRSDGIRAEWRDGRRLVGTFLLRALERGERVGRGMRARGGARAPSPYAHSKAVDGGDYALAVLSIVAVATSVVVRWGF